MDKMRDYKKLALQLYRKTRNKPFANTSTIKKEFPKFDGRKKENWILLISKLLNRTATFEKKSDKAIRSLKDTAKFLRQHGITMYSNIYYFVGEYRIKFTPIEKGKYYFDFVVSLDPETGSCMLFVGNNRGVGFVTIGKLIEHLLRISPIKNVAA